jgi:uncharacterized protein
MISQLEPKRQALTDLCRRYGVARLELFGSAALETFDPKRSDVDFLVEFLPDTDLGPWLAHYFELKEALEDLLGRKVDLVMVGALRNPYFASEANRSRRLIYAAEDAQVA